MDEGRPPRFARPRVIGGEEACAHLFVANCGPKVGISLDRIAQAFGGFGDVVAVRNADDSGARVIVSFTEAASARDAMVSLDGARCPHLDNRVLHVSYSSQVPCKIKKGDKSTLKKVILKQTMMAFCSKQYRLNNVTHHAYAYIFG